MSEELIELRNAAVSKILTSGDFNEGELSFFMNQVGCGSGFTNALWGTLFIADEDNLARLEKGFPEEVQALREWRGGSLKRRFNSYGYSML